MFYKHTQTGWLMIWIMGILVVYFGYIMTIAESETIIFVVMAFVFFIIASFSSLTVATDETYLRVKFGYGIFSKKFKLEDITDATSVKNKWYYGWGIRYWIWPKMIIYNVSGFDAVQIKTKEGRTFRIGTDESKELEYELKEAIKRTNKNQF